MAGSKLITTEYRLLVYIFCLFISRLYQVDNMYDVDYNFVMLVWG